MTCLLDTCAWIWDAADRKRLTKKASKFIDDAARADGLRLSVISCWEVAKLVQKGKIRLGLPVAEWVARAVRRSGLQVVGLTPEICVASTELPGAVPTDPADQLILATARMLGATVVTADRQILDYDGARTLW